MAEPVRVETEVEVRYFETDAMGVVHHAHYLVWFEQARTRLCAGSGYHYAEIEELGYFLMTTGAELSYRRPARYGERVLVACWLDRLDSRLMRFAYDARRGDEVLATGSTTHIWVERASGKPCRIPEPLREPFEQLREARDASE